MSKVIPITDAVPAHLSAESKRLLRDLQADYSLDDSAGQALLLQLGETLDHLRACQKQIKEDGLSAPGSRRGTVRPHPLLKECTEARRHILAIFRSLNLDLSPPS
ncbi:hypothetical protein [Marinimicrobium sp. ABcell2]|uniref:hypothetical protein n=1 Tax=Marinimicrobium sp. ABcell2 TaxID=3069751 RepID=UPI0027B1660A|nr:hypothetical protein [Marinimicrobium sp. ABcell2]MDQ2077631.1 hypothetical protein [Marinimicrobium sp. ABcell2]